MPESIAESPTISAAALAAPGVAQVNLPGEPTAARQPTRRTRGVLDLDPVDVSVCIANWNCQRLLRACLASLHGIPQGVRLETIVVDNASTDGAADLVAREFPEVLLIRNPSNVGFSRANNQAAAHSRGRYLLFLNNDTEVPAGTLRALVDQADALPEVGILGPRLIDGAGRVQVSVREKPSVGALLHRTLLLRWTGIFRRAYRRCRRCDQSGVRSAEILMGAAMLLPRHVFFATGGWDEDFVFGGEDLDLSLRVGRRHPLVYLPGIAIIHHGRASTRENLGFSSPNVAVGFARFLRKHGVSAGGLFLYKLLLTADAPLQLAAKLLQYGWRRLRGRREQAERSLTSARATFHFLCRGLSEFWKV